MLSGYNRNANQNKPAASAKVSATSVNAAAKKDSTPGPKTAPGQCHRCGDKHGLADCPIYRDMSASDRRKFNKNLGICFKCLEAGHLAKTCSSTIKCDRCDDAHHPLAHPEPNPALKKPDDNKDAGAKDSGTA